MTRQNCSDGYIGSLGKGQEKVSAYCQRGCYNKDIQALGLMIGAGHGLEVHERDWEIVGTRMGPFSCAGCTMHMDVHLRGYHSSQTLQICNLFVNFHENNYYLSYFPECYNILFFH